MDIYIYIIYIYIKEIIKKRTKRIFHNIYIYTDGLKGSFDYAQFDFDR
jgi:hypothetical protein